MIQTLESITMSSKSIPPSILAGYREEKAISAFWVRQLPVFLKLLEIGVYLESNPPYDPETAGEWGR